MIKEAELGKSLTGYVRVLRDFAGRVCGLRAAFSNEVENLTREEIEKMPIITMSGNVIDRKDYGIE